MTTKEDILTILKYMLEFNPSCRPSADILLKNKIFEWIRIPNLEKPA